MHTWSDIITMQISLTGHDLCSKLSPPWVPGAKTECPSVPGKIQCFLTHYKSMKAEIVSYASSNSLQCFARTKSSNHVYNLE